MKVMFFFRYLRAIFNGVAGWFGSKTDSLQENKNVMSATYDAAISNRNARLETVKNAVAELLGVEQERKNQIKELGARIEKLKQIKNGTQTAMQRRLDELKATGKTKEQIIADPEFAKHNAAFTDANNTLAEVQSRFDEKDADLKQKQALISQYKNELQKMQRANENLKNEKNEAIADVAIAQQQESINATLAGIPQDVADQDLEKARTARNRVVNRAKVTSELTGNDAKNDENEYLKMAENSKSAKELDSLLNWGDDKKEADLSPAKLPEN